MTIAVWVSWFFVALLTGINVFVFLKLKGASEQMMKMAFPGAKNMNEAVSQMQKMMGGMGGMAGMGGRPGAAGQNPFATMANNPNMQAQMKAAMDMLAKMQQNQKKR